MRVRTLLPMAADGIGPSLTCVKLVAGAALSGADIDLLVTRYRMKKRVKAVRALLHGPLAHLPYRYVQPLSSAMLERWYLSRLRDGETAWLWPAVSLATHEEIARRGNPILLEGINTRMKSAKTVLDAAYHAFGAPPAHGITEARIAEEEAKLALAFSIFAPSPTVEAALVGSPLETCFLSSSYGVDTHMVRNVGPRVRGDTVTFMFCGHLCIRKGANHLLNVWEHMPKTAKLLLVGRIEPLIAQKYADLLSSDQVEAVGHTNDVAQYYQSADAFVFPSLEEGDPLVTYEAALHGLAIVTSPSGAGRIGADNDCMIKIDPVNEDALLKELMALHDSDEKRAELGARARASVLAYDWNRIGEARMRQLSGWTP